MSQIDADLRGRTVLMSGGSRGIGLAIACAAARRGANVAFIAKTVDPNPRIPGTVFTAAEEIAAAATGAAGVLPVVGDIRSSESVEDAVAQCVERFGGIDIVVNNASAINLGGFGEITGQRFTLLMDVNVHGTFQLTSAALPHLLASDAAQVLTLSPPLDLDPIWLQDHAPYTLSKYGMSILTLGLAAQFRDRIAAYCLWPETLIATAAVQNIVAGNVGMRSARRPEVMADAAVALFGSDRDAVTGRCHIDAHVLAATGVTDFSHYAAVPGTTQDDLQLDLFVNSWGSGQTP